VRARANTLFTLGLAAGLAVLTLWLEHAAQAPMGARPDPTLHNPDFIVERFTATSLDKSGRPERTLTAKRMIHYPDDETTELFEPRLVQLPGEGPQVRITAERGTVTKDGEEVRLYGNVVVIRDGGEARGELRMETTYLQVFPKEELARTPEAVLITEGRSRLAGVGMEYNHKTRQFTLKARVTGTIDRFGRG
jgi:lipopolysaccharide export system protein LptC